MTRNRSICPYCKQNYETPRGHNRAWTPQDDAHLMELINRGVPRPEVARQIGRTIAAMNTRLRTIRLTRKREGKLPDPNYSARYEQWEFDIVLERYPDRSIPVKDIAVAINRTEDSVYRMAAMLGVKRGKRKDAFKKGVKHDPKKRKARVISDNPWANIQGSKHD